MGIHFRAPDDYIQILEITPATRRGIEDAIERLIALLDQADPDADLEDSDTDEPIGDEEPSLGWADMEAVTGIIAPTPHDWDIDLEATDEDGGDILDEPHDARDEGDDEPDFGRIEMIDQGADSLAGDDPCASIGAFQWHQDGQPIANQMLRERGLSTVRGVVGRWW